VSEVEREERIDNRVDEWHDAPEGELDGPLHEALGWTSEEYAAWLERNELPPLREGAY
jgi:hypothetical protein